MAERPGKAPSGDTPAYGNNTLQEKNVISIAELKEKYGITKDMINDTVRIDDGIQIKGVVTGNDAEGNIYNEIALQDETGGILVCIAQGGLCGQMQVGQEVLIDLGGLYIGAYRSQPQIGVPYTSTSASGAKSTYPSRIARAEWQTRFKLIGKPDATKLVAKEFDYESLKGNETELYKYAGCLVKATGVGFAKADGHDVTVVEDVGEAEVDRQRTVFQIDAASYRTIEHEATMTLGLAQCALTRFIVLVHNLDAALTHDLLAVLYRFAITIVGRVRKVDAVIIVAVQAEEPSVLVIVHAEACSCERCAAVAHTFIIYAVPVGIGVALCAVVVAVHCARHRLHVGQLGVVDDLGVAYCTEQLNVEGACHLKLNACLHAIIFLLHVSKRHILERVDVVMIEVLPVGHVVQTAVVGVEVEVHPCVLILVAQFCAEHALVLEVTHKVVVDLRTRLAASWCA